VRTSSVSGAKARSLPGTALLAVSRLVINAKAVTLKRELSSLDEAMNFNALDDWEKTVTEFFADLKAGVDELKTVTPQTPEEQHEVFLLKKGVVDTLVERIEIDRERNLHVQIRLNLLDILRKDARNETNAGVQNSEGETYTRIPDMYPTGQILIEL
jgi:hypothetical protein